tara:strand:+ start:200 stop:409 length:210 start_codon:yes stop_codon:yes gene_type:complete
MTGVDEALDSLKQVVSDLEKKIETRRVTGTQRGELELALSRQEELEETLANVKESLDSIIESLIDLMEE